jgi:hypothetical protein
LQQQNIFGGIMSDSNNILKRRSGWQTAALILKVCSNSEPKQFVATVEHAVLPFIGDLEADGKGLAILDAYALQAIRSLKEGRVGDYAAIAESFSKTGAHLLLHAPMVTPMYVEWIKKRSECNGTKYADYIDIDVDGAKRGMTMRRISEAARNASS